MYTLHSVLASRWRELSGSPERESRERTPRAPCTLTWPEPGSRSLGAELQYKSSARKMRWTEGENKPRGLFWGRSCFPGSVVLLKISWQVGGLAPSEWPGGRTTLPPAGLPPTAPAVEQVSGNETNTATPT